MKSFRTQRWMLVAGACALASGCSQQMANDGAGPYQPPGGYAGSGPSYDAGLSDSSPEADAELPPEQELESSYQSPVATDRFVWVANPMSGRVAYVDAVTLDVRTTEAGNGPTYLAAVPDAQGDVTLVINTLSSDATLLRATAQGDIESRTFALTQQANSWAVSRSGQWAIAWTDALSLSEASAAQGFQDITVLRLTQGAEKATRLSVGYRPIALSFSQDEKHAYAVTQDGVSVLSLQDSGDAAATGLVALSDNPLEDPGSRDVSITPDGRYAFVRRDGSREITVVGLESGQRVTVQMAGPVTDLDIAPDGTQAIAVVRDHSLAALLPIPEIVTTPTNYQIVRVTDAVIGSVALAAQAPVGILYSNASDQQRLTKFSYQSRPVVAQTLGLHAPVRAVFLASTGESAIILHNIAPGSDPAQDAGVYAGAFSVQSLTPLLPAKIVGTLAPAASVAQSLSGSYALVTERDDTRKLFGAYLIRSQSQQVDRYDLASPPIAAGMVTRANRAFVAQKHPEGRITFIDLDSGTARTLTGFELGSRVVNGTDSR